MRSWRRVLPGPYTFILEATREVPKIVQSKRKTVGIRVPNNPVVQALVQELGRPVITSTAVFPGGEPFIDPEEIDDSFKGLALVIDGGAGGLVPTTVVDLTSGEIEVIREGAGPLDDLFG
jgi:tRNA threonylcarbamoyl adenosine modification protein (Sua5/YciO/YrdC/YwlC family)